MNDFLTTIEKHWITSVIIAAFIYVIVNEICTAYVNGKINKNK